MLKLNIGFNRKVGEANFGSRGASVNLEIEVESGLVREPDKLQAKIGYLFELAKASVESQLNGGNAPQQPQPATNSNGSGSNGSNGNGKHAIASTSQSSENGNGHHGQSNGNSNGHGQQPTGSPNHRASQKQVEFANQLSRQIKGLGVRRLEDLANKMFGKPLADLSSLDASSLIDTLKAIKEGRVALDEAMNGAAT